MSVMPFLHFFCLVVYLFLAGYILKKNPKALLNRLCAALISCFALWSLAYIFTHNPDNPKHIAIFFGNVQAPGWIFMVSMTLWFFLAFTERKKILRAWWFYLILFLPPIIFTYKQWTGGLISDWVCILMDRDLSGLIRYGQVYSKCTVCLSLGLDCFLCSVFGEKFLIRYKSGNRESFSGLGPHPFSWEFYQNIITTMADALILVDSKGDIITINNAALNLLDYKEDELKGQPLDVIFPEEVAGAKINEIVKTKLLRNFEFSLKSKVGNRIPVSLSSSTLKGQRGKEAGVIYIARDMSHSKKVDEELKTYREHQEEIVEKRTGELQTANLQLQQEISEHMRTGQKLKESEEKYSSLFHQSSDAFIPSPIVLMNRRRMKHSRHKN